jgi:hypothetical protein
MPEFEEDTRREESERAIEAAKEGGAGGKERGR